MVRLRRIVVPVDLSRRCSQAAEYASGIARHYGSELTLLHVVEPPRFEFAMLEPPGNLMERMVAERVSIVTADLDTFIAEHLSGLNVRREVLQGQPAESVVSYCVQHDADLVVMPTRGRNPLRQFILGSVAAKVLHDVPCAVVTGIHLEREFGFPKFRVGRVLSAVDLGPHSNTVLHWGAEIAREFQADYFVIHVAPGATSDVHRSNGAAHTSHVRQTLEKLLASLPASMMIQTVVRSGEPHKEISQAASGLKADLVVIGRGTAGGMLGRLRAHSYAIVREAPCPVLSV